MEIKQENGCNGIKRKKPLKLECQELDPMSSGDDDRPPEIQVISKKKPKDVRSGDDAQDNKKEELELADRTDAQIEESIARFKRNLPILSGMLRDKGEKYQANLRRCEEELERRKKLQSEKQSEKGDKKCEEAIHLPDDGASCGEQKGDQKSSSSLKFFKILSKKIEEDKDSRTVNAFKNDLSSINPCQGRKPKPNSHLLGKGKYRMGLSSRSASAREPSDGEKHIISNDDNKDDDSTTATPVCLAGNKPCSNTQKHDNNLDGKMVQTRTSSGDQGAGMSDTILTQLAAIEAKLEAIDTLKADIAALKAKDHSKGKFSGGYGGSEEGEGSWYNYRYQRPHNKIEFPKFSDGDPRGWLLKAEKYFRYYQIPEEDKIEVASLHLEGEALDLYSWLSSDQPTVLLWEDLVHAFNKNFGPTEFQNPDEFLCSIKQIGTVQEYQQEFAKRSARVSNWPDHCLLGVFLNGLKDELKSDVRIHKPCTVYNAMSLAMEFETKSNHTREKATLPDQSYRNRV